MGRKFQKAAMAIDRTTPGFKAKGCLVVASLQLVRDDTEMWESTREEDYYKTQNNVYFKNKKVV